MKISISYLDPPLEWKFPINFYLFYFDGFPKAQQGYLTREDFIRIPELAINPLGDRIVHAFFYESKNTGQEKVDFKVRHLNG